ncbi:uncharacterized protein LOC106170311 isoform X2 [Lingula anatina]|uniref:Uncharacterized protein LOC106170311 isoform X2 n=1 Tax=Lingula anatina TaxID=7574 RepID=A0A1S3J5T5_LINAN|nr:uncharacterized protein LOC106170311 isoform X2 [Lingula anatina]|eukprot:XP_013405611.1 uncharacterized protein LOC106170311 isoform X2 [Lingula anatina]
MCTSTGARLAHVDNRATMDALIRQIQMVSHEQWQFRGNYWIGAVWNRTAPFKWIWETGGKVNYSNWLISPQMNPSIIQAAKLAFKQDFMWMSESITSLHHFICQFAAVVLEPSSGAPTLKPTTAPINHDPTTGGSLSTTEQDVSIATSTEAIKLDHTTLTSGIVTNPDTTLTSDIVTKPATTMPSDIVTEPDTTIENAITEHTRSTLMSDYLSTRNVVEPNKTNGFATPTKNGLTPRTVTISDNPSARERKQNRPMWGLFLAIFIPVLLVSIAFTLAWFIYKKHNNAGHRRHLLMKESIYTTVQNPMYKTGLADTPTSGNKAMASFKGKRPFCNQLGDDVHYRMDRIAEETSFDVNRCHSIEERTVEIYDIVDFTQIRR